MCCNRCWFNPWEDPETSPWRNFWEESFWNDCVLGNACHNENGEHDHCHHNDDDNCNHHNKHHKGCS